MLNLPNELPEAPPTADSGTGRWRRGWWIHLLLLAAYPLLLGALGAQAGSHKTPALGTGAGALLAISTFEVFVFGLVFGLAWLASRATVDQLLFRWRGGFFRVVFIGFGYSVLIRVLLAIVIGLIAAVILVSGTVTVDSLEQFFKANRPEVEALVDVKALRQNPLYFWLSLTLVSFVVAGLREELWRAGFLAAMRALWPQRFGSLAGQTLAVGVSAIIFGLGHLAQGTLAMGLTALLGFALGMIIVLHRSLWPAVIAHGFFDAVSFALLPLISDSMKL